MLALILGCVVPTSGMAQEAEEYRLGVQDRLLVKVGRWRAAEGVYETWEGLSGEYAVGPSGMLSLALAGSVRAEGRTIAEVAEEISLRVQRRIGMAAPPVTSIEVVEFRPIYVVGAVNNPGEFRYRPQMTVLQAVGLAGGHLRTMSDLLRPERETLIAVRDYEVLRLRRWRMIARLARLEAELAGAPEIAMPEALSKVPNAAELLGIEREIFFARLEAVRSKKLAIEELKALLTAKIDKLGKEIALRGRQVGLAHKELKKLRSLVKQGLTVSSRETAFGREVVELEAKQLELEVAKLSAEQQLNEAARDELDLVNERRRVVVTELQEAGEALDEIEVKFQAAQALVSEVATLGGELKVVHQGAKPTYRLSRREGGRTLTLIIDEQDAIRPGDTLLVIAPEPELAGSSSYNADYDARPRAAASTPVAEAIVPPANALAIAAPANAPAIAAQTILPAPFDGASEDRGAADQPAEPSPADPNPADPNPADPNVDLSAPLEEPDTTGPQTAILELTASGEQQDALDEVAEPASVPAADNPSVAVSETSLPAAPDDQAQDLPPTPLRKPSILDQAEPQPVQNPASSEQAEPLPVQQAIAAEQAEPLPVQSAASPELGQPIMDPGKFNDLLASDGALADPRMAPPTKVLPEPDNQSATVDRPSEEPDMKAQASAPGDGDAETPKPITQVAANAPASAAVDASGYTNLAVTSMTLTRGVVDKEPIDAADRFSTSDGQVYAFVRVRNPDTPTQITFSWYLGEQLHDSAKLKVGRSTSWRTWSKIPIQTGKWRVQITDESGGVLAESGFTVK